MEQNESNQNIQPSNLCRTGCGFYNSPQYDGMCSKCYKDYVNKRQQSSSPNGLLSPQAIAITEARFSEATISEKCVKAVSDAASASRSLESGKDRVTADVSSTSEPKEEKPCAGSTSEEATPSKDASSDVTSSEDSNTSDDKGKKPKKHRCHMCKKKVGLTGFECRCGGLYCSVHRYSDKHDCNYDYKQQAQAEIRKANPVVQAQKVTKI